MAKATIDNSELHVHQHGQNGVREFVGCLTAPTTDASFDIDTPLDRVIAAEFTAVGTAATVLVNATPVEGVVNLTDGVLPVTRSTTTNGQKILFRIQGR